MAKFTIEVEIDDPDFTLIDAQAQPMLSRQGKGQEDLEGHRLRYVAMDASGAVHAFNLKPQWDPSARGWIPAIATKRNEKSHVVPIRSFSARIAGAEALLWERPPGTIADTRSKKMKSDPNDEGH
jgi:hypothetical protein